MEDKTHILDAATTPNAIIVGVQIDQSSEQLQDSLDELQTLLKTLGVNVVSSLVQKRQKLSPSSLLGSGKVEELKFLAQTHSASLLVFDNTLSGPQVRNLERMTSCMILDRSGVILEIFVKHAKSKQSKTQVEIARLEYLLPRLTGAWTHFQRQKGGGVRARGMGEKQIEVDRRLVRQRISRLQNRLERINKERKTQRKLRSNQLKVAIVGYTNSGKTTIMKGLTKAAHEGRDELFATLDACTRPLDPVSRPKILMSDTVGFIRNLPHSLIESFKSTLEEVKNADLLVHVVDVSQQNYDLQIATTESVLDEIGAGDVEHIVVLNKVDKLEDKFLPRILKKRYPKSLSLSALCSEDLFRLRDFVFEFFSEKFQRILVEVPSCDRETLSFIHRNCLILGSDYSVENSVILSLRAPVYVVAKLASYTLEKDENK